MVPGEKDICKITKKLAIPKIIKSQHRNKPINSQGASQNNRLPRNSDFLLRKRSSYHFLSFNSELQEVGIKQ
ncbi:hypothetical protein BCY89_24715 [Sphingobacterium siyangense]|uniref:Uncharacterized protein n=1 Tax=Sphingobacterium siyangense TaxID=459529 RepID=A0A420G387_9SPHI|nr:hypothetical protein BCY89_24715 [Sphingobacterium siyangense]